MSFLDRIKGTAPAKPDAQAAGRLTRPFDELSTPTNAMEATARFGPGGDDTRNDTRSAGADSTLSSIISEASPSEAAADLAAARAGQPGAAAAAGSGLPVIGGWPIERQQRVLTTMLGLGLVALLLTYIILGAVMDELSMLLLTIPIFFPMVMGLDFGMPKESVAIWFGIMVLMTVGFGLLAPPVGLNVYVVNGLAKDVPISESYKGVMPFLISDTLRTILLLFFPAISLWLVKYVT